ncbi:MAG: putative nucleotidyltransferase [Candidatus Marinamargulisbacteria bacterium]|jgi:predicted nucleotidyltransferase
MNLKNFLSDILVDSCVVDILRHFFKFDELRISGNQLASTLEKNQVTLHKYLDHLYGCGILNREIQGRAHVYMLSDNHYIEILRTLFDQEALILGAIKSEIKKAFQDDCIAIVLFGSYSNPDVAVTDDSDIDVFFLAKKETKKIEAKQAQLIEKLKQKYATCFSPYNLTVSELKKKRELPLIKNILKVTANNWLLGNKIQVKELIDG